MTRHRTSFLLFLAAAVATAQEPTPDALFSDAVSNLAAKKYAEAEAAFRGLRAMEPANVRGVVGVAQTLMAQAKFEAALQYVTAEVAKEPGNAKLNLVVGDIAAQAGQMEIAAVRFQRTLDLIRNDPNAATFFVKRTTKSVPETLKDPFTAALENFTGNDPTPAGPGGVYSRLAEVFLRMGDGPRGVDALENARRFLPSDPGILSNLAVLYQIAKNDAKALVIYRDLLKVNADDVVALNNSAFILAESGGDLDEALRDAMRAQKLQPVSPEIADTLGWVHYKRRSFDEAIPVFARAVQQAPDKAPYREHLRLALEAGGDKRDIVVLLIKALAEPPSEESNRALVEILSKMYPQFGPPLQPKPGPVRQ